jgi:flagellar biosynthesis/type III secretory pathway chaperone
MTKFDFNEERLSIVDAHNQCVNLSPLEAVQLLEWLSARKTILSRLARRDNELLDNLQDTEPLGGQMEQLEIHLLPQQLVHLDELQAAMPQLQEHIPATNIYVSPIDAVTERAIALLKEFEIEYKIHPLLEDSNEFAQG